MKRLWTVLFITISVGAADHKKPGAPDIYVHEESGKTNRIATGKVDCATDENFGQLLKNGQYDLCRAYLSNKTLEEIALLKIKYGIIKIDNIMGALYAVPEKIMTDQDKKFVQKGYKNFPLHARAFFGDKESIKWFLKNHSWYDISTTTDSGYTASDVARNEGYTEVAQMLTPTKRSPGFSNFAQSKLFWLVLLLVNCHLYASSQ